MKTFSYEFRVFDPAFAGWDNEAIYDGLCAATTPIDAGLAELHARLRPIIMGRAEAFLKALAWTMQDAVEEGLIFLWELVRKRSYKRQAPFHNFFGRSWGQKLNSFFQKAIVKNLVYAGDVQIGWCSHQPVFISTYAEHEKAAKYRQQQAERNRVHSRRHWANMTAEQKAAANAKRNEQARTKRAAETPEQREARIRKRRAYEAAKKARAM